MSIKRAKINLEEARGRVKAWENLEDTDRGDFLKNVKGFTIDNADLKELAKIEGAHAMRVYLGVKEIPVTPETPSGKSIDLLVVAVEKDEGDGTDLIDLCDQGIKAVYDFTHPCPPTCGTSVLFTEDACPEK